MFRLKNAMFVSSPSLCEAKVGPHANVVHEGRKQFSVVQRLGLPERRFAPPPPTAPSFVIAVRLVMT